MLPILPFPPVLTRETHVYGGRLLQATFKFTEYVTTTKSLGDYYAASSASLNRWRECLALVVGFGKLRSSCGSISQTPKPAALNPQTRFPLDDCDISKVSDETLIGLFDTAPVLHSF
ncbi:hypothetical protein BDBG_16039 [Blastomyces gilchristii SLH14081]|uniref:Uncharacterized protein n=1 Tax=Blastomyces gilchristii (strain SLH14081) TaxID=559298 RepID=A0A179U6D0_BLAGS|nr:uncharacterized protein BDBG_16039 [Blastomyces gilchristii SLH14081]OAT03283.1 hypothetical protein BDBG_16039 [Blastomyces gilchristii SLH14081]